LLTAFLQSVVFQSHELIAAMANDGAEVVRLRVDGGMSVNSPLCQFLADIIDVPVERPENTETTALGAAILAAVGHGTYADLAATGQIWQGGQKFMPAMEPGRRTDLLAGYQRAVGQALNDG
jgi:glycerol kinase